MASHPEVVKPLSLWEKVKAGVKGAVQSVAHGLPSSLLFGAAILGGAVLLAGAGFPAMAHLMMVSQETLLPRLGITLLIGGAISGVVGAYQGVKTETAHRNAEVEAQAGLIERGRACGPERQQEYNMDTLAPQQDLPRQATPPGVKSQPFMMLH